MMNKQQYLDARATWKAEYAQLTLDIRAAKAARSETARAYAKHGPWAVYSGPLNTDEAAKRKAYNVESSRLFTACLNAFQLCKELRADANKLLTELEVLKRQAQESYTQEKSMTA